MCFVSLPFSFLQFTLSFDIYMRSYLTCHAERHPHGTCVKHHRANWATRNRRLGCVQFGLGTTQRSAQRASATRRFVRGIDLGYASSKEVINPSKEGYENWPRDLWACRFRIQQHLGPVSDPAGQHCGFFSIFTRFAKSRVEVAKTCELIVGSSSGWEWVCFFSSETA